jgi:glycine betaine/proline transport system substrate-binding protein
MDQIDNDGEDPIEATKAWLDENEDYWIPMVEKAKQ